MLFRLLINFNITCLLFTACSSGYRAQPIETPSEALEAAFEDASADPLIAYTAPMPEEWWGLFYDDQLSCFIQTAFQRNPTIQEARSNILFAVYNADLVRSSLYPTINWGADVLRSKFSETGIIPFNMNGQQTGQPPLVGTGGAAGIPVYFTQYETEFTLSYDFDIWGKRRSLLSAALGEVQANIADEMFIRLQLGVAIAEAYYQVQVDYQRIEIASRQVAIQERVLELTRQRAAAHLDSETVVNLAEAKLAEAKQVLYQILGHMAIAENQLRAYLAGNFDEMIWDMSIEERPLPRVPLPGDLPFHLIAHRPDVISQLWLIESAGEQIEAAKAGFYPDFSLTGLFGYQTIHLRKLFEWPSSYYSVDPAVLLPVFDGGKLIANLRGSEVSYDQAIYEYNQLVLNAVREVLDGIALLRYNEKQLSAYHEIFTQNAKNLELAQLRLNHNLSSELDLLNSESSLLKARDQEIGALGNTLHAILSLIKALGGGYETCMDGDA